MWRCVAVVNASVQRTSRCVVHGWKACAGHWKQLMSGTLITSLEGPLQFVDGAWMVAPSLCCNILHYADCAGNKQEIQLLFGLFSSKMDGLPLCKGERDGGKGYRCCRVVLFLKGWHAIVFTTKLTSICGGCWPWRGLINLNATMLCLVLYLYNLWFCSLTAAPLKFRL